MDQNSRAGTNSRGRKSPSAALTKKIPTGTHPTHLTDRRTARAEQNQAVNRLSPGGQTEKRQRPENHVRACSWKNRAAKNHRDLGDRKHGRTAPAWAGTNRMVKNGAKQHSLSFNQKLITKWQNLTGARFESSEQKSHARNLIWWHKNKDQWDLPMVRMELSCALWQWATNSSVHNQKRAAEIKEEKQILVQSWTAWQENQRTKTAKWRT
jgi:hypothetical protein